MDRRGSILLEYIVVLLATGIALVAAMDSLFFSVRGGFGPLGLQFAAFFRKVAGGISLPVP